jgi:hypothetical protein
VDELLEQREHPWNPARLHREWVEQKLTAAEQKLDAIQQQLTEALARSVTRPWVPSGKKTKVRILVDTLDDLFRGTRGVPPVSLSEVAVEDMLIDRLKVTEPGFTFKRTSLRTALKLVRSRSGFLRVVRANKTNK